MPDLAQALQLAIAAGAEVAGTTSPNPAVGAVILDRDGEVVGIGATQPPGGPHAEVMALRAAGSRAAGGTAVVTLEPCNHTGRTGPCAQALVEAGISAVAYAQPDTTAQAAGGALFLREQGIAVTHLDVEVPLLEPWLRAVELQRPAVTLKFAQTLDGFTAAQDGTSQWITGEEARAFVHADRARRDAIIIGTGTALADRPRLTARRPDGTLYPSQPRRVVIGSRPVSGFRQFSTIPAALHTLWEDGARDVLVEGGAGLATAFVAAGYVDFIQAYIAPALLGDGRGVLATAVSPTLRGALRWKSRRVRSLGQDILWEGTIE